MDIRNTARAYALDLKVAASVCAAILAMHVTLPAAATTTLAPAPMPLTSSSDEIFSFREEDHSWQTPDGAVHLMINAGDQPGEDALQLYTTPDGGSTWAEGPTLAATNSISTQDGFLLKNTLALVYSTDTDDIVFDSLTWNSTNQAWTDHGTQVVFASDTAEAVNPCIARDAQGTLWVPFAMRDITTNKNSIHMMALPSGANEWVDTGLTFGNADRQQPAERSARPVQIPGGMGMIYTVHDNMYWATRDDSDPIDAPWTSQLLYTYTGDGKDPYRSHFSLAADAQGNVHLAFVDGGRLMYMRYNAASATWQQRWLSNDIGANYPEVTLNGNTVFIATNSHTNAGVYISRNGGNSFTFADALVHSAPTPGVSYQYARIETASYSTSPVMLFQQYSDNGTQRLLQYSVPVSASSSP